MTAPLRDFPSISSESLDEILTSRLAGESDLHFNARIMRIACTEWLDAHQQMQRAKLRTTTKAVLQKFQSQELQARGTMTSYAEELLEALHKRQSAPNGAEA